MSRSSLAPSLRFALLLILFAVLSVLGVWWALAHSGATLGDLSLLSAFPTSTKILLLLLCLGVYITDVWRYLANARALGVPLGWKVALEASVANFLFSWITPGATLGAPAAIYVLGKRGVSWDAAALISFGKSMLGSAFLLVSAFAFIVLGLGPRAGSRVTLVLLVGSGVVALLLIVPLAAAVRSRASLARLALWEESLDRAGLVKKDGFITAVFKALRSAIERLARFQSGGWAGFLEIAMAQFCYFSSFIGIAAVLAWACGAVPRFHVVGISTVYLAFTYVAPTPGGAGLSEAFAVSFFGPVLSAQKSVLVVLLFRSITLYVQIAVGLVYLAWAGGLKEILKVRRP